MRLLFDQNLSPRLLALLADLYGGSTHVRNEGLEAADDDTAWEYAALHGFAIVSKDADFHQRSFLLGAPPKVIWIQRGNCVRRGPDCFIPCPGLSPAGAIEPAGHRRKAMLPGRGARPTASRPASLKPCRSGRI